MLSHIRNKRQAPPRKVGQGPKGAPAKKGVPAKNGGQGVRKVAGPNGQAKKVAAKGKNMKLKLKVQTIPKRVQCSCFCEDIIYI